MCCYKVMHTARHHPFPLVAISACAWRAATAKSAEVLPFLEPTPLLQEPRVLLCDEATSALDARTETDILAALQTLAAGRTSLFVAHRLSTAAQCNKIVVLEEVGAAAST